MCVCVCFFLPRSPFRISGSGFERIVLAGLFWSYIYRYILTGATSCAAAMCSGSLCAAGKYGQTGATSSAASTCSGSLCTAGKYCQTGATSSAAATCAPCPVGTYSETEGLSLQSTRSLAPGHLFESLHHSSCLHLRRLCTCTFCRACA